MSNSNVDWWVVISPWRLERRVCTVKEGHYRPSHANQAARSTYWRNLELQGLKDAMNFGIVGRLSWQTRCMNMAVAAAPCGDREGEGSPVGYERLSWELCRNLAWTTLYAAVPRSLPKRPCYLLCLLGGASICLVTITKRDCCPVLGSLSEQVKRWRFRPVGLINRGWIKTVRSASERKCMIQHTAKRAV